MLHLEGSLVVNGMTLRNRLVMPPMATERSNPDGSVSEKTVAYYEEKAADETLHLLFLLKLFSRCNNHKCNIHKPLLTVLLPSNSTL